VLEVLIESLTLSDFFTKLGAVTDTDTIMNPHFGSDPADISGSGPGTSPEIRIRIPDHFWLRLWRWRRFALFDVPPRAEVCTFPVEV